MAGHRARRPSGNCPKCGAWRQSLHRDHIMPRWKGGTDEPSNIQFLCANCHEDKTREDMKGIPGPRKGKKVSEESRKKMRESHLGLPSTLGFKGKKHSEEALKKMRIARSNRPHPMPPASDQRKRRVSESLKAYHAANRSPIPEFRVCNKCGELKDTQTGFYWRKAVDGRRPCAVCKKCKPLK